MSTHSKKWLVALALSTIAVSLGISGIAYGSVIPLPNPPISSGGIVRNPDPGAVDLSQGVDSGPTVPSIPVGSSSSLPVPHFAAVDAPVWFTDAARSVQISNDVTAHGFVDAQMGLVNSQTAAPAGTGLVTPVTVYDDLYVAGNGASEPGNVVIKGALTIGQVNSTSQVTGDLNVTSGGLTVAGGNITATSIGSVVTPSATSVSVPANMTWSNASSASCATGDTLISCTAKFDTAPTGGVEWYPEINGSTCSVKARLTQAGPALTVRANPICFNPDGR